jgi:RimJ/RimL family protein N-acetyltransferase
MPATGYRCRVSADGLRGRPPSRTRPGQPSSRTRWPKARRTSRANSVLGVDGVLREVVDSDVDAFFEHQREPEANRMAAFPARDREAFDAHWRRLLADDSLTKKTIVYEGEVAGNVGCWEQEGRRLVGYWIGREFWGKGLATRALQELTGEVTQRPLHAWVATSNVASIRVLEKCGFVRVGSQKNDVEELLFKLRDSP